MSLAERIEEVDKDGNKVQKYVPVHSRVKAVGVWDTVGSLGIPRMPLHSGGRREQEVTYPPTHQRSFPVPIPCAKI